MGITGLIPFLEKASCPINIRQYKGQTVAIDAYCWLHRGIFSCADKIARGEKCDQYITYCLKYVNMLISHDIKPILVFDGRYLPAKAATEKKRRQSREQNKVKAAELLRQGRTADARRCLRNSVDVGPEMAVAVARACRSVGADCIFAPFEADAQLAYLTKKGIATAVITEDSDLILFGCGRVIFKLDLYGSGLEVVQDRLHLAMGVSPERFSMDRFRQMCILSGCDYLASLPGIGLAKAKKFVNTTSSPDISQALGKLPSALGMYNLIVTEEYMKEFLMADATFLYQIVYDPVKRSTVPLNDPKEVSLHIDLVDKVGGDPFPSVTEFQLALGNLDPFSLKNIDDFVPDSPKGLCGGGIGKNGPAKRKWKSIWEKNFVPWGDSKNFHSQDALMKVERDSTWGKDVVMGVSFFQNSSVTDGPVRRSPRKRKHKLEPEEEDLGKESLCTDKDLGILYGSPPKKPRLEPVNGIKKESPAKMVSMVVTEILGEDNGKLKRKLFLKSSALSQKENKTFVEEKRTESESEVTQEKKDCTEESELSNSEEISSDVNSETQLKESDDWLENLDPLKTPSKDTKVSAGSETVNISAASVKEEDTPTSPIIGSRCRNNPFAKSSGSGSVSPKISGGILGSSGIFSKMKGLHATPEGVKVVVKSKYFASSTSSLKEEKEVKELEKAEEGDKSSIEEECLSRRENVADKIVEEKLETEEEVMKTYAGSGDAMPNPPAVKVHEVTQSSPRRISNPFPMEKSSPKSDTVLAEEPADDEKPLGGPRKPLFNWGSLKEKFACTTSPKNGDIGTNSKLSPTLIGQVQPKESGRKNPFGSPPTPSGRGRGRGTVCRRPGLVRTSTPKTKSVNQGSDNQQSLLSRFGFHKKS